MGEELPFGGTLFLADGTKFCKVEEIPVFTETYDPDNPPTPMPFFNTDYEITVTFKPSRHIRRTLLGWTAKGPVRWRQVRKAMMTLFRR